MSLNIHGHFEPEFSELAHTFEENFRQHDELGAALAVVERGKLVVDIWGGYRDPDKNLPWEENTLVNVWSTTKGVTAACVGMLVDRGLLDYEAPVAKYWPEFGKNGKDKISVRMLLSHQAGLCGFRESADLSLLYNASAAADRIAAMAPLWEPGDGCGYHAISIGYLVNELFIRVDGRSIKDFVKAELHDRLGLDIHIGSPAGSSEKLAVIVAGPEVSSALVEHDLSPEQTAALANPILSPELPNTEAWRAAEIPSANGFASARALASLYGKLAIGVGPGDFSLVSPEVLEQATTIAISAVDRVLRLDTNWAAGFLRNTHQMYGPSPAAYGHSGWGGAFAFADPDRQLGVAYVMNRMGPDLLGDPRNLAIVSALYERETKTAFTR